jgi:beta-1,4-mannosyl-glycoprotein beta-1,4-N-acetylglucosaminyltransferase
VKNWLLGVRGIVHRLPAGTVCIYGATPYGALVRKHILASRRDIRVACYLDIGQSGEYDGLPLMSPQALLEKDVAFDYVLIASKLWEEIEWFLQDLGMDSYCSTTDFPSPFRTRFRPLWVRYLIWKGTIKDWFKSRFRQPAPLRTGKVYDCFSFFNELDLLEIRLNVLDPVVDRFVLVEANKTHTGKSKPYYFDENKERYARFLPKITHIKIDDFPRYNGNNSWRLEKFQRNAVERGLGGAQPDDVLIVSDLDEIPRPEAIARHKNTQGIKLFCQRWYRFYLNYLNASFPIWRYGSRMGTLADLDKCRRPSLRPECPRYAVNEFYRYAPCYPLPDAGWHFSFLGGIDAILEKIDSLARPDNGLPTLKAKELIERKIANGEDISGNSYKLRLVELDQSFPDYILKNRQAYAHLVASPGTSRKDSA